MYMWAKSSQRPEQTRLEGPTRAGEALRRAAGGAAAAGACELQLGSSRYRSPRPGARLRRRSSLLCGSCCLRGIVGNSCRNLDAWTSAREGPTCSMAWASKSVFASIMAFNLGEISGELQGQLEEPTWAAAAAFGSAWLKLQLSPKSQPRKDRGPPEQAPLRQLPLPAELRRRSNNQVGPSVNPTCLVQVSHARPLNRRCVLPQAWGALGVRGSKSGAAAACTLTEGHLICHRKHRSGH